MTDEFNKKIVAFEFNNWEDVEYEQVKEGLESVARKYNDIAIREIQDISIEYT